VIRFAKRRVCFVGIRLSYADRGRKRV
jgi:hypothetical protein